MKRRKFIVLSTTGALAAGAAYWHFKTPDYSLEDPQILSQFLNDSDIVEIGKSYRRRHPEEDHAETLLELLIGGDTDENRAVSKITNDIENDYEKGNTLVIDGWVISVTEARQSALFSIKKSN